MPRRPKATDELLRTVRLAEGAVSVDRRNRLLYRASSRHPSDGHPAQTMVLEGAWQLTRDRELAFAVHAADDPPAAPRTLYLKGAIVEAKADALVFALRQREDEELRTAQRITLSGRWRADDKNRLTFLVERGDGTEDRLTLEGGWEMSEHHEVRYRFRQRLPGTTRRQEHILTFEGAWDVTSTDRLVYRLSGSDRSAFEFRAALQSPSLLAKDGRLVYQVGIGLSGGKTQQRRVTLFGTWKLNRDASIAFEVPYGDGRVQAIRFEGTLAPTARDRLTISLQTHRREPLGLTVTFTRDLVPDARLFLRLRKDAEERSVIGGVQVRF